MKKILLLFSFSIISILSFAIEPNSVFLKSAGCKTEFYLIKALVKGFAKKTTLKIIPARSGNAIAIKLLLANQINFAFCCKPLTKLQKKFKISSEKIKNWKEQIIAKDPIVIITNRDTGITNLTTQNIQDIYTLKITNWNELGGKNLPIKVAILSKKVESGVNTVFKENIFKKNKHYLFPKAIKELDSPRKIGSYIQNTSGSISCIAIKSYKPRYGQILNINNITPNKENIKSGKYPICVTYSIIFDKKNESEMKLFINFIKSKDGQQIINDMMISN
jgi:phosphate transport system substrate-binding protein